MLVVKLGGSLYHSNYLAAWMSNLAAIQHGKIVLVPGGGPFADQVRSAEQIYSLPDTHSHAMAVLAMQQFAWLLASLDDSFQLVSALDEIHMSQSNHIIWLPYDAVMQQCDHPHNWQTTSDSLACWLAQQLDAEKLLLIKSQPVQQHEFNLSQHGELLDSYFPQASKNYRGQIGVYHASQSALVCEQISHG